MTPAELRARTHRFALEISKFCDTLPRDPRTQEIADQLHDSAHSASINYRAVCRARTAKEFIAKLCIVVEESDEAQGWLQTLLASGKGGPNVTRLLQEATELVAIFTASKHTWLQNHPSDTSEKPRKRRRGAR
jgi:four helix bundle protein